LGEDLRFYHVPGGGLIFTGVLLVTHSRFSKREAGPERMDEGPLKGEGICRYKRKKYFPSG